MSQAVPTQELAAKDLHGYQWRFKHIYRGQPRRHLLTTGWSTFVTSKRLVAGDTLVFLRGDNGELRIGIRRPACRQMHPSSSVISSQSMHLGVLAAASHAIKTQTLFVVYYKPRKTQFIIVVEKYLAAISRAFAIGMRCRMRFEEDDGQEKRLTGTVIGNGAFSKHWPRSPWRSLMVQWDESAAVVRQDRVSPWEVEPVLASTSMNLSEAEEEKSKRPRPADTPEQPPSESSAAFWFSGSMAPQFQALMELADQNGSVKSMMFVTEDALPPPSQLEDNRTTDTTGSSLSCQPLSVTTASRKSAGQKKQEHAQRGQKQDNAAGCWLFGIDLTGSSSSHTTAAPEREPARPVADSSGSQSAVLPARTCTKVRMQGVAVGRAVDLNSMKGYEDLIDELEKMFEIKVELSLHGKWSLVFTDDEDDMMLVGDDPWMEFCRMARKIFICPSEQAKKMNSRSKKPPASSSSSLLEEEETIVPLEAQHNSIFHENR